MPNTLADAGKVETRLSDIGAEISASMPLSGVRPMTAPLVVVAGSAAAPGLAFAGDTSSGVAQVTNRTAIVKGGVSGLSTSATDVQVHLPMTVGALTVDTLTVQTGASGPGLLPAGTVIDFAGQTVPPGWLLCNGQPVSRTTYPSLFIALGTTYGAGDGSTTFNVPDYRGRIGVGLDNMGASDAGRMISQGAARTTLGGASGADTHSLTGAQTGPHAHSGVPTAVVVPRDGWGTQGGTVGLVETGRLVVGSGGAEQGEGLESLRSSAFDQSLALVGNTMTVTAGGGTAHNNVQPSIYVFKIIRT